MAFKRAILQDEANIGTLIHEIRKKQGMTLRELSAKSGATESAISRYESGQRVPTTRTFFSILDALGAELYILHN